MSIMTEETNGLIRLAEEGAVSGSRAWTDQAACASPYMMTGYDAWFGPAEDDEGYKGTVIPKEHRKVAKGFCVICPVKQECLEYAMSNDIKHGIWGGKSPEERKQLRRQRAEREQGQ